MNFQDLFLQAHAMEQDELLQLRLDAMGSWPEAEHLLDRRSILAIAAAIGANRPLLIRGEPGVGKSNLARAAAKLIDAHFISTVVQPLTEYQDLLWQIDYTQRLADAQLASLHQSEDQDVKDLMKIDNYVSPGPLWWAFNWADAEKQSCQSSYQPEPTKTTPERLVLLIDEIDKADMALSNGLLEVLGNAGFKLPHREKPINSELPPLVIITSNSVRELPRALLRRCVLLDLKLPGDEELTKHLVTIGQAHFPELTSPVLKRAVKLICDDRLKQAGNEVLTGQAEFVDLLRAVSKLNCEDLQLDALVDLAEFYYKKQASI